MSQRSSYKSYQQAFAAVRELKRPLFVLKGDSSFLLMISQRLLVEAWSRDGWECDRTEGAQLNAERFLQATAAKSLFDPKTLTLVGNAFQSPDLLDCLKGIAAPKELRNPIGLVHSGDIPAKFQKELDRLGAAVLPCDEPFSSEFKDFAGDRCQYHGVKLQADAMQLLLDAVGLDMAKIENELLRISLCIPQSGAALSAADLRPHLAFVREDHAFLVDQYLCQEAFGKALLLLKDLLDRGESALAVLAILAMHCRKALQIQSGMRNGSSPADLSRDLRLPRPVVQSYLPYIKKRPAALFVRALNLCHEADRRLKSRGRGEELYLDQIVWELMPQA